MKKLSILFFSLLAVTMFTACNDDNEKPVNKQTVNMDINNRAIDGENVVFSQSKATVEVNFTDMTIKFNTEYTDATERPHTLTTPEMNLTNEGGMIYSFGRGTSEVSGYIDFNTSMMWYTINNATGLVVSTSQLVYAYSTTTVTNPDNGYTYSHEHSAYLFILDSKCEKCSMKISNFSPNIAGSVEIDAVQFNDLTITPTATGYTITAAEAETNNKGYKITDLNVNLNEQCQAINGSFKCKDLNFTVTGKLFPNMNSVPF